MSCGCGSEKVTLLYACSGASNVGQLSHTLALHLTETGLGKMSCLAGVGAHLSGFVTSARDCDQAVVIDGCPQRCAAKIFEHQGLKAHLELVLTDHGFVKRHGASPEAAEVERAAALVKGLLNPVATCSTPL